jgi:hypothetical protein
MLVGAPLALHGDELVTTFNVTIHGGELKRYSVWVRCTEAKGFLLKPEDIDVSVFAADPGSGQDRGLREDDRWISSSSEQAHDVDRDQRTGRKLKTAKRRPRARRLRRMGEPH